MASKESMISSFIESAPPGELNDVINDIKSLTIGDSASLESQEKAFKEYNEAQFTTTKLPGGTQEVLVSPHNSLEDGRYYDVESQTSFTFDHATQKAADTQSHVLESQNSELIKSLLKSFKSHAAEHFPSSTAGVFPIENDEKIAIILVANKYSPNNFWNGRWRSTYILTPSDNTITGSIKVDVHYYEDGNVRLLTEKPSAANVLSTTAQNVVKHIAQQERKYQEELNRAFGALSEGAFKSLRRQLPVTRQKVEWDKIGGYRLGQDIGGGRQGR